ncbi:MAG: hypothetical protein OEZ34_02640 [Spirochaetia bacterium]|nr:hypothetical protein [Spirochaetia bacterium]
MKYINKILFIIVFLIPVIVIARLDLDHAFTGDSMTKLLQSYSLYKSGLSSDQFYYPAEDFDPEYQFFPGGYLINMKGKFIGPFPVFFAFIGALLLFVVNMKYLIYISLVFTCLILYFLIQNWRLEKKWIFFLYFSTPFLLYSVDFSEVIPFMALQFAALSLFLNPRGNRNASFLLSGALFGVGVFLRLEAIPVAFSLGAAVLFLSLENKFPFLNVDSLLGLLRKYSFFIAGFIVMVILFFLMNYILYGNTMGPRWSFNYGSEIEYLSTQKLEQFITLLFFGIIKLGFFGYMPLFLLVISVSFRKSIYSQLDETDKIILFSSIIFLLLVSFSAPNDSIVSWGPRYLAAAILPMIVFSAKIFRIVQLKSGLKKKLFIYFSIFLVTFSVFMTYLGFAFAGRVQKQLAGVQRQFNSVESDYRIYEDSLLMSHVGFEYFERKILYSRFDESHRLLIDKLKKTEKGKTICYYKLKDRSENNERQNPVEKTSGTNIKSSMTDYIHEMTPVSTGELEKMMRLNFKVEKEADLKDIKYILFNI